MRTTHRNGVRRTTGWQLAGADVAVRSWYGDELDLIGGRREQLVSQIGELYRVSATMAQTQVESWQGQQQYPLERSPA